MDVSTTKRAPPRHMRGCFSGTGPQLPRTERLVRHQPSCRGSHPKKMSFKLFTILQSVTGVCLQIGKLTLENAQLAVCQVYEFESLSTGTYYLHRAYQETPLWHARTHAHTNSKPDPTQLNPTHHTNQRQKNTRNRNASRKQSKEPLNLASPLI